MLYKAFLQSNNPNIMSRWIKRGSDGLVAASIYTNTESYADFLTPSEIDQLRKDLDISNNSDYSLKLFSPSELTF